MKKCQWCKKAVAGTEKFCSVKCKEKKKAYFQRPDVKEKNKAYHQRKYQKAAKQKTIEEYLFLLGLKTRNQRQQIRLLALAEYFGRDYEERRMRKKKDIEEPEEKNAELEEETTDENRSAPDWDEVKLKGKIELVWPSKDFVFWDIENRKPIWRKESEIPSRIIRQKGKIIGEDGCAYDAEQKKWIKSKKPVNFENLLIKGDNLLALKALEEDFAGQVKLIYIDPPFNTGTAFEHYDDGLEHSTWLSMMKPRLAILWRLLKKDGAIFVHIDDNEYVYLRALLDEQFGRSNFVISITVKRSSAAGHKTINPTPVNVTEHIVIYAKEKQSWIYKPAYVECEYDPMYSLFVENVDAPHEKWKIRRLEEVVAKELGFQNIKEAKNKLKRGFDFEVADFALKNAKSVFESTAINYDAVGKETQKLFDESEKNPNKILHLAREERTDIYVYNGRRMTFYYPTKVREIEGRMTPTQLLTNLWADIGWHGIANEGGVRFPKGKKPEKLLRRIIELGSNPGDLVLDSFAGSGTTGAVAHKMGRRWVMIEMGKHAETLCKPRLSRVVSGEDQTGISKVVGWQGGGGFTYCELGEPLIVEDAELGIKRINPVYNNGDLIKAVCRLEGFGLIGKGKKILHGKRGTVYAHVTEFFVNQEYVNHLAKEIDDDEKLRIYCYSHSSKLNLGKNVELRRMPDGLSNQDSG